MPLPTQSIFHDESWSTPWRSSEFDSEFPPNETNVQRTSRQRARPDWASVPPFLSFESGKPGGWPWGWAIYRTSYTNTSDKDWAKAIEKLDQACLDNLTAWECAWARGYNNVSGYTNIGMIRDGYRSLIFEDPALEGASVATIRTKHLVWAKGHGLSAGGGTPRLDYCLLLDDRCVRSILASAEAVQPVVEMPGWRSILYDPGAMVGYVNVVDSCFDPEDPEDDTGEFYQGMVRVHLDCLCRFAIHCEDLMTGEHEWGEWGMDSPYTQEVYTDGYSTTTKNKETFLSSPNGQAKRTASVTESEYIKLQG